jgi:hypothetical protein
MRIGRVVDGEKIVLAVLREDQSIDWAREGDHKGWSTALVTALDSWGNPVPRGHFTNFAWKHSKYVRKSQLSGSLVLSTVNSCMAVTLCVVLKN